jgi:hypothetical protein
MTSPVYRIFRWQSKGTDDFWFAKRRNRFSIDPPQQDRDKLHYNFEFKSKCEERKGGIKITEIKKDYGTFCLAQKIH